MKTLFNFFAKRNFSFSVSLIAILFIFLLSNSSNAQLVLIGSGSTNTTNSNMYGAYCEALSSHKVQYMYLGSELVANGASVTGNSINTIAFYCNTTTAYPLVNWNIKISQSNSVANLSSPYTGTFTTVYTLPSHTPIANGWNTYTLPTPYYWQGVGYNLVVEVCNDLTVPSSSASGTNTYTSTTFTSVRYISSDIVGQCGTTTVTPSTSRANVQFTFSAPVSCSGTPTAATISANQTSVCPGNSFTLSANGINSIYGLTYQWQSSSNCTGTWGNISGATGIYFVNSQTNSTCYRLLTTCTPSALSIVSNTVTINTNTPSNCYCSGFPTSASDEDIGNVTVFNSSTLNNTSTCSSIGPGPNSVQNIYSNYSTLPSLQLAQTTTATFSLKSITCGGNFGNFMQIYIDYNVDGDFNDAGELVCQPTTIFTGPHTETGSFIIPMNATIGSSRLRVRVLEEFPSSGVYPYTGNANACYQYQFGETEDYNVNISSPSNCTGLPSAGTTATTSLTPVCSNQTFILSTTTAPSNGTTITYQWEENCNSMGWTNIGVNSGVIAATPNNLFTSVTNLPSAPSCCQFRLRVVCGFSGQTAISAPVTVCGDLPTNCYCIPSYTNGNNIGNGDYLNQIVDFGGYAGPVTGPNSTAPNYYIYTPATIASIAKGSQYNITLNNCPLNSEYFRVWIDFDQDGIFSANECISDQQYPGGTWLIAAGGTSTATFTCPTNAQFPSMAATFNTRARFRCAHSIVNMGACATTYSLGETEDYIVTVNSQAACSGVPTGGTTNTSDPSPCIGLPFTLSVSGATSGVSGLTYQWQSATSCAGPWTNLGTSLSQPYSFCVGSAGTIAFRRAIICGSNTTYSSCLSLTSTLCYCAPSHTLGTSTGCYIDSVKIEGGGLNHGSGANATSPYFSDFSCLVPAGIVMIGGSYWVDVSTGSLSGAKTVAGWFDWNQDGDFVDIYEAIGSLVTNLPFSKTHHFVNVPVSALVGTTRMRVRISDVNAVLDPCLGTAPNYVHGESEDYVVNIIANVCNGGTQPGTITISPTTTVVNDFINVTSTGGNGTLIGYEVDWSAPYDFTPANTTIYSYDSTGFVANINPSVPQGIVYVRAIYKNGACPVAYSNSVLMILDCAPSFALNPSGLDYIANIKLGTGGSIINNTSTFNSNGSAYQNFTAQGPFSVSRGVAIPFQVCVSPTNADAVRVWIDENGDGSFSSTETYYSDGGMIGCHPWGTITIPAGSGYSGLVKMRVLCLNNSTPNIDPCNGAVTGANQWGEFEEYMLNIQPCQPITVNPILAICTGQTAVLNATGPAGTTNFQWNPTNGVNGVVMIPANGSNATVSVQTTYPSLQIFTVTGTLANGCISSNTVQVSTTPVAPVVTPASSIICSGGIKLLTATGLPPSSIFQWEVSNDNITWANVSGLTGNLNPYTTQPATSTKYYRVSYFSNCFNIYSNSVKVETASTPVITFTNGTSSSVTVNWTPVGGGSFTITWSGAGSGTFANATPPITLTGLTPGITLTVTVTQTNPVACPGVSAGTATYTVPCVAPAAPTTSNITASSFTLNWLGSGTFKVFYKPIITANYSSVIVTGNSYTVTGALSNMLYNCYIQKQNCPTAGTNSSPSPTISLYTLPAFATCPTPTPFTSNEVSANCGNTITVALAGNPSNTYVVYFQRTCPPPVVSYSYNVTGTSFSFNAPATIAGSCWNVFAQSTCGPSYTPPFSLYTNSVAVNTQPICPAPNPAIGQITCVGFTIAWPQVLCGATAATNYKIFIREVGTTVWVNYNAPLMQKTFTNLLPGHSYDVFVRAFGCNNAPGIASAIQTVSTLPVVICRLEEQETTETIISNSEEQSDENVYPNPADHFFYIEQNFHNENQNEDCIIYMMDLLGRTVLVQPSQIENGSLKTIVDLPEAIAAGIYLVEVRTASTHSVQRIIISK